MVCLRACLGSACADRTARSGIDRMLADSSIAGFKLNGNFRSGDSASIASTVEQVLPVRVERHDAEIVLRPE